MDEIHKIILETVNAEKVETLNQHLKAEQQAIIDVAEALKLGTATQAQYDIATTASASRIKDLTEELRKLGGRKADMGGGLLGASYGAQDFITVLSGGGGLGRALASAANNVSPLVLALGGGAGLAGVIGLVVTGISAAIPLVEGFLGKLTGDAAEKAKKELEEIEKRVKGIHEAFLKLTNQPTEAEKEAADVLTGVLGRRPVAERAKEAVARGISEEEALTAEGMTTKVGALDTDEQLQRKAAAEAAQPQNEGVPDAYERALSRLTRERDRERRALVFQARRQRAEEIVAGATVAGPKGEAARRQLMRTTRGVAGLEAIQDATPEAIRRSREEFGETVEGIEAEAEAMTERGAERRRLKKQQDAEMFRQQQQAERRAQAEKEKADREGLRGVDRQLREDIKLGRAIGKAAMQPPKVHVPAHIPIPQEQDPMADAILREATQLMHRGLDHQTASKQATLNVMMRMRQMMQQFEMRSRQLGQNGFPAMQGTGTVGLPW